MAENPYWLEAVREDQSVVWLIAVLFYGIGDTATTVLGLRTAGAAEVGPVAGLFIDSAGLIGLVSLKIVFLLIGFVIWHYLQTPSRAAIPLAIAVAGVGVTAWNAVMLVI